MKVHFDADVPGAVKAILREEGDAYAETAAMTAAEKQNLTSRVASGNSPYSSPCNLADESGRELDFLAAIRIASELASELAID